MSLTGKMHDQEQYGSEASDDEARVDIERVSAMRQSYQAAIERILTEVMNEEGFQELSLVGLRVRRQRLVSNFEAFENIDILYRQRYPIATDQVYLRLEQELMIALEKIDTQVNNEERNVVQITEPMERPIQVIKVETARRPQLTKFNGSPSEWPAFRDLFLAEVHNKEMESVQKLLYLQGACTGKASKTLGPWPPTNDNYLLAWDTLVSAYEDNYHIVHDILGSLYSIKKQEKESYDSIRTVLDSMSGGLRQLSALTDTQTMCDQMWIHYAKQRLPKNTIDAWEQHRTRENVTNLPTLDEFKRFMESKARGRREYEEEPVSEKPPTERYSRHYNRDNPGQSNVGGYRKNRYQPFDRQQRISTFSGNRQEHATEQPNERPQQAINRKGCVVPGCDATHPVYMCDAFRKLNIPERLNIVRQSRLCHCCLNPGHFARDCQRGTCTLCPDSSKKHHIRLCEKSLFNYQAGPQTNRPSQLAIEAPNAFPRRPQ
jgi:hypothetical protein